MESAEDELQGDVLTALVCTTLSGLSTGVGGAIVVLAGQPSFRKLGHMLSFSAGVMMYISYMDLLAEATVKIGLFTANVCFFAGMLFFAALVHLLPEPSLTDSAPGEESRLLNLGFVTAVGISIHNFPEGIAVYLAALRGLDVGLPLSLAIALHNVPEGMAVATPIYHATRSKWEAIKWSTLSGMCEPLGALVAGLLLTAFMTPFIVHCLLAAVGGIMVYLSLRELIPTAIRYIEPESAIFSNLLGQAVVFISLYYLRGFNLT